MTGRPYEHEGAYRPENLALISASMDGTPVADRACLAATGPAVPADAVPVQSRAEAVRGVTTAGPSSHPFEPVRAEWLAFNAAVAVAQHRPVRALIGGLR